MEAARMSQIATPIYGAGVGLGCGLGPPSTGHRAAQGRKRDIGAAPAARRPAERRPKEMSAMAEQATNHPSPPSDHHIKLIYCFFKKIIE